MQLRKKIKELFKKTKKKEDFQKESLTKNIFVISIDSNEGPQLLTLSSQDEGLNKEMMVEAIHRFVNPSKEDNLYSLTCEENLISQYPNLEIFYSETDNPNEYSKILSWFAGYPINSDSHVYVIIQKDYIDKTDIEELPYDVFAKEVYDFYNEAMTKLYMSKHGISKIILHSADQPVYINPDLLDSFYDEILHESFQPGSQSSGWQVKCLSGDSYKTDLYKKDHILMSMTERRDIEIYFTPEEANKRSVN